MKNILARYQPQYPKVLLYMLQGSEYKIGAYFKWLHRTKDFRSVMKRRQLVWTSKVKLLALSELVISILVVVAAWYLMSLSIPLGVLMLLLLPFILAYGVVIPLFIGEVLIQRLKEKKIVSSALTDLKKHEGVRIAIAGSYGKTTTKEVLKTVLSEAYKVAATPGNMNTPIGTSRFINSLDGDEDIIIFEMGESHVGDVMKLCKLTTPDIGVVTGINQAHLETFKTIDNIVSTIFELEEYLKDKPLYKNYEDKLVQKKLGKKDTYSYDGHSIGGWKLSKSKVSITGTEFTIQKEDKVVWGKSELIGEHILGTLLLAVAIGDQFGMSASQIAEGMRKIKPFEHRMAPRHLHGAWIIDDTYNGNIRGVEAGLKLLKDSKAKRRIYVTPGLVEQGHETASIHRRIGKLIASSADVVVLMKNSVTDYILEGIDDEGFKGEVQIIDDPLHFYTNIEYFIASGDIVLMQNDWPDNYA